MRSIIIFISVILSLPAARAQSADQTGNAELARSLNVSFSPGSSSVLFLERDGKRYAIDVAAKSIRESPSPTGGSALFDGNCSGCHGADGRGISSVGTPDFTNASMHATLN